MIDSLITTYTITGLTAGNTYKFKIRAKNIYGSGSFSSDFSFKVASVPAAMSEVTVTEVTTNLEITWVAPNNRGDTIDSY